MIVVVGEAVIDRIEVVGRDAGEPDERVGGGPLNIAVGLSRLDEESVLLTQLCDDDHGATIRRHLAASGVELIAAPTATGRTSTSTARLDAAGGATYEFDLDWSLPHQELPRCDALHVGSIGTALDPGRTSVHDLVDQAWDRDVFCSYDPNLRPAFLGDPAAAWQDLVALAERASLVKLSEEDIALVQPGAEPGDIARVLLTGEGTDLVVVTHGAAGAAAYASGLEGGVEVHVPTPRVEVVDTVGAGDSFMAALLAVLSTDGRLAGHGRSLPVDEAGLTRLLDAAATAAAITCSRPGADPPTRPELPASWPDPTPDG